MMGVKPPESAALPPHILSFSSSLFIALHPLKLKSKKQKRRARGTQAG
jgi:hypothetical protein